MLQTRDGLKVTTEWLPPLTSGSSYSSPDKLLLAALSSECKTKVLGWINNSPLYQGEPVPSLFGLGAYSHAMLIDLKLMRDARALCPADDKAATLGPQTETPQEVSSYFCHCHGNRRMTLVKLIPAWIRPKTIFSLFWLLIHTLNISPPVLQTYSVWRPCLGAKAIQRHMLEWL